jgi:hypothetical protein
VLADEPSGRLYKALVEVGTRADRAHRCSCAIPDFALLVMVCQDTSLDKAREVFRTIDDLETHPITDEISRQKRSIVGLNGR